jgi:hypothetical protein
MRVDLNGDWFCYMCGSYDWTGKPSMPMVSSIVSAHTIPSEYRYCGVSRLLAKIQKPESV